MEPVQVASGLKTVLVVDDRPDDLELLRIMFRRSRIRNPMQTVDKVHDAICYLKGEGVYADRRKYPFPVMALLDLHLPDGCGFDVLRWIRANRALSPLAVVVLSGSDVMAFRQAYELGAHSFLVKPLKFEEFHNMVSFLRGIKMTRTAEGYVLEPEQGSDAPAFR